MGLLVEGQWRDQWYDTDSNDGRFKRSASRFRNWVTPDGKPGPQGEGGFGTEPGRYHLYVSFACPWAHRTLIFRKLKALEPLIDVSVVHWQMAENGWTFAQDDGATGDRLYHLSFMHQLYTRAAPDYSGRVTVPVLWDKQRQTIVSNESADIIRMFNTSFDAVGAAAGDYYPESLRCEIDAVNDRVYSSVNNGVYKAGFATSQKAYEEALFPLFETLDWLESRLDDHAYIAGDQLTEADWRLFTTLVRFDSVYAGHFKCNMKRLVDYPRLWSYVRELYQMPGIAETVHMDHIKKHYYVSHTMINPTGVVPVGPRIDFLEPHKPRNL